MPSAFQWLAPFEGFSGFAVSMPAAFKGSKVQEFNVQTISNNLKPLQTISNHFKQSQTILNHFKQS
ncbi:MAG: hypothetical protein II815_08110, partial [Bacteroidales bacterium]|nr:hypothetical protein [Bacteroidales bacterium]